MFASPQTMISCVGKKSLDFPLNCSFTASTNVVRHERFAIVLPDVAVRQIASFAAQVAGELAAVVVFHDEGVPCVFPFSSPSI